MVRWLKHYVLNAGGPGLIPDQGIRSHMLQLEIPHATAKTEGSSSFN